MPEPQIDFDELMALWDKCATEPKPDLLCVHFDAVTVDENGVYCFQCNHSGRRGYTNEVGARLLGWIE